MRTTLRAICAGGSAVVALLALGFPATAGAAAPARPIEGTWEFSGGAVVVRATGATTFSGVVSRATKLGACVHPAGQTMWRISGSGTHYTGTHTGYGEPSCTPQPGMRASWDVREAADQYSVSFCADVGGGDTRCVTLKRLKPPAPPAATTAATDTEPPQVEALPSGGAPGAKLNLGYRVSDDSGRTRDTVTVYRGRTVVAGPHTTKLGPAVAGKLYRITWQAPAAAPAEGVEYRFCIQAHDAAGNRSAKECAPITIADTSRPVVKAVTPKRLTPGARANLQFTVSDDSGSATVHAALYEGGFEAATDVGRFTGIGQPTKKSWSVTIDDSLLGPLYFCVWAEDAAGNRSANGNPSAPEFDGAAGAGRSCAWVSLLVDLGPVSNGCGGTGWDAVVAVQNYLGNTHTYQESLGTSYTVSFVAACDLHDAGYGGFTVRDRINGGVVDYRGWSRPRVDRKFLADLRTLCARQIPATAKNALEKCTSRGGTLSYGARALYDFVDKQGWRFFDADLTKVGTQKIGHRRQFD